MQISSLSSYIPEIRIASPEQAVRNLTKIALPAIALVAASMMRRAQATTYVECINQCDTHQDADLTKLLCYALCAIFSKG